jgi:hypothetical protein
VDVRNKVVYADPLAAKLERLAEQAEKNGRGILIWKWRGIWYAAVTKKTNTLTRELYMTWSGNELEATVDAALEGLKNDPA